jgi:hypothetical protein
MECDSETDALDIFPAEVWQRVFLRCSDVLIVWEMRRVCRAWRWIVKREAFLEKLVHAEWQAHNPDSTREASFDPTGWSFASSDVLEACGRFLLWKGLVKNRIRNFGGFDVEDMQDMEDTILFSRNALGEPVHPCSTSRPALDTDTNITVTAAAAMWSVRLRRAFVFAVDQQQKKRDLSEGPIAHRVRGHQDYVALSRALIHIKFSKPMDVRLSFEEDMRYLTNRGDSGSVPDDRNGYRVHSDTHWKYGHGTGDRDFRVSEYNDDTCWEVFVTDEASVEDADVPKDASIFLLPVPIPIPIEEEDEIEMYEDEDDEFKIPFASIVAGGVLSFHGLNKGFYNPL